jgi:hypothetical protein
MKQETQSKMKYGSWGLVIGAAIAMIIGFGWGGWSTASATQKITEKAILEGRTAICVAQFMADFRKADNLVEFEKIDSWKRYELVDKGRLGQNAWAGRGRLWRRSSLCRWN